ELCQRVAGGDERAFDCLVTRYQQRAWRVAWNILGDAEEARDASQDAFVTLYRSARQFRGHARFSTWFYRVLVNACLQHRRRHRWWRRIFASSASDDPENAALDRQPAPIADALALIGREQAMTRLQAAMARLSPKQRAALTLQLDEVPTAEIAD